MIKLVSKRVRHYCIFNEIPGSKVWLMPVWKKKKKKDYFPNKNCRKTLLRKFKRDHVILAKSTSSAKKYAEVWCHWHFCLIAVIPLPRLTRENSHQWKDLQRVFILIRSLFRKSGHLTFASSLIGQKDRATRIALKYDRQKDRQLYARTVHILIPLVTMKQKDGTT